MKMAKPLLSLLSYGIAAAQSWIWQKSWRRVTPSYAIHLISERSKFDTAHDSYDTFPLFGINWYFLDFSIFMLYLTRALTDSGHQGQLEYIVKIQNYQFINQRHILRGNYCNYAQELYRFGVYYLVKNYLVWSNLVVNYLFAKYLVENFPILLITNSNLELSIISIINLW